MKTKVVKFTHAGKMIHTGEITVPADTDEEAMKLVRDPNNWVRYLELSHDYDDDDWEFEIAVD